MLTATPVLDQVLLEVLDQNYAVVAHVRQYLVAGPVHAFTLDHFVFTPEEQTWLHVTDDHATVSQFGGLGIDGLTALPNGPYHMRMIQPGKPDIDADFWIKHGASIAGNVSIDQNPVALGQPLRLRFAFGGPVNLVARIYNLAGELVCQQTWAGTAGNLQIKMQSSSGLGVSAGVYLIDIRGATLSGGDEVSRQLKFVVLR